MSPKTYALYISAVSTLGYVNAYNMNGDYAPVFEGYKIAVCPGMADDELVAAQKSNLFFGTDLLIRCYKNYINGYGSVRWF